MLPQPAPRPRLQGRTEHDIREGLMRRLNMPEAGDSGVSTQAGRTHRFNSLPHSVPSLAGAGRPADGSGTSSSKELSGLSPAIRSQHSGSSLSSLSGGRHSSMSASCTFHQERERAASIGSDVGDVAISAVLAAIEHDAENSRHMSATRRASVDSGSPFGVAAGAPSNASTATSPRSGPQSVQASTAGTGESMTLGEADSISPSGSRRWSLASSLALSNASLLNMADGDAASADAGEQSDAEAARIAQLMIQQGLQQKRPSAESLLEELGAPLSHFTQHRRSGSSNSMSAMAREVAASMGAALGGGNIPRNASGGSLSGAAAATNTSPHGSPPEGPRAQRSTSGATFPVSTVPQPAPLDLSPVPQPIAAGVPTSASVATTSSPSAPSEASAPAVGLPLSPASPIHASSSSLDDRQHTDSFVLHADDLTGAGSGLPSPIRRGWPVTDLNFYAQRRARRKALREAARSAAQNRVEGYHMQAIASAVEAPGALPLSLRLPEAAPLVAVTRSDPRWVPTRGLGACQHCSARFTFVQRKHHCRGCGAVLCAECTPYKDASAGMPRVCRYCAPLRRGAVLRRGVPDTPSFLDTCANGDLLEVKTRLAWGQPVNAVAGADALTALHVAAAAYGNAVHRRALKSAAAQLHAQQMASPALGGRPASIATTPAGTGPTAVVLVPASPLQRTLSRWRQASLPPQSTPVYAPDPGSDSDDDDTTTSAGPHRQSLTSSPAKPPAPPLRSPSAYSLFRSPLKSPANVRSPGPRATIGGTTMSNRELPTGSGLEAGRVGVMSPLLSTLSSAMNAAADLLSFRLPESASGAGTANAATPAPTSQRPPLAPGSQGAAAASAQRRGSGDATASSSAALPPVSHELPLPLPPTEADLRPLSDEEEKAALAIVKLLISSGAAVTTCTHSGRSALHCAAAWGTPSIVQALLDAGALQAKADKNGLTAYDYALLREQRRDPAGKAIKELLDSKHATRVIADFQTVIIDASVPRRPFTAPTPVLGPCVLDAHAPSPIERVRRASEEAILHHEKYTHPHGPGHARTGTPMPGVDAEGSDGGGEDGEEGGGRAGSAPKLSAANAEALAMSRAESLPLPGKHQLIEMGIGVLDPAAQALQANLMAVRNGWERWLNENAWAWAYPTPGSARARAVELGLLPALSLHELSWRRESILVAGVWRLGHPSEFEGELGAAVAETYAAVNPTSDMNAVFPIRKEWVDPAHLAAMEAAELLDVTFDAAGQPVWPTPVPPPAPAQHHQGSPNRAAAGPPAPLVIGSPTPLSPPQQHNVRHAFIGQPIPTSAVAGDGRPTLQRRDTGLHPPSATSQPPVGMPPLHASGSDNSISSDTEAEPISSGSSSASSSPIKSARPASDGSLTDAPDRPADGSAATNGKAAPPVAAPTAVFEEVLDSNDLRSMNSADGTASFRSTIAIPLEDE